MYNHYLEKLTRGSLGIVSEAVELLFVFDSGNQPLVEGRRTSDLSIRTACRTFPFFLRRMTHNEHSILAE
jgi:hypothetical protein